MTRAIGAALVCVGLAASACGAGDDAGESDGIAVAASTSAWGSVVETVGGDRVDVTSVIEEGDGDPHSYESTASDGLAFEDAELAVYNGGGYDDFAVQLAEQADVPVVEAMSLHDAEDGEHADGGDGHAENGEHADGDDGDDHGDDHAEDGEHADGDDGHAEDGEDHGDHADHGHDHADGNEHVWYDFDTVAAVAQEVANQLGEIDAANADEYSRNAEELASELDGLTDKLDDVEGASVIATEPLAEHLLDSAGISDETPDDFSRAIEDESDVPVAVQNTVRTMVSDGAVDAVIENAQTETPVTKQLVSAAQEADVPVVSLTETIPADADGYGAWMSDQIDDLHSALDS